MKFKSRNTTQCSLAEGQDGVIVNTKTNQPFTDADPCVEYGWSIAYNEKASSDSRRAIKEFLTATFKLQ